MSYFKTFLLGLGFLVLVGVLIAFQDDKFSSLVFVRSKCGSSWEQFFMTTKCSPSPQGNLNLAVGNNQVAPQVSIADQLRECLSKSDLESKETCDRLLKTIDQFYQCVQAGFPIMKSNPPQCQTPDGRIFVEDGSKITTLSGTHLCLPKNTDGPTTEECALGILTGEGSYYALEMSVLIQNGTFFPTGSQIEVSGFLIPIEEINTNIWQKYDIKGILKVTDGKELD